MAIATNTFTSFDAVGNKEDVSDVIYNVDPEETPFLNSAQNTTATNKLHQWQTDTYAAAAANAQVEGDDSPSATAVTATTLLSNTCQISRKIPQVSGSQEAIASYGRESDMGYQVAKMGVELKRDMETVLLANNAEDTGGSTQARNLGALLSWIDTNTSAGSGGSDGSAGNTARTDGTQRAFTEDLLTPVLQSIWDNGGNPNAIMLGSFNKRQLSGFSGNATRQIEATGKRLVTSIEVYESDWGVLEVVPNRFMRSRDVLILEMQMWAIAWLRPFHLIDLAKQGDAEKKMLLAEYTLEARNEQASGGVFDLTTS